MHDCKELKFIKKQEASGLLKGLGRKTPLSKTPLVGPLLFKEYKINRIVNRFLLSGDTFLPDTHLRQPGFTSKVCGPFTKDKKEIQKFKETGDSRYIYQNELDKACFQHGMAYGDFKDLTGRTASDKILHGNAINIAKNPEYDG